METLYKYSIDRKPEGGLATRYTCHTILAETLRVIAKIVQKFMFLVGFSCCWRRRVCVLELCTAVYTSLKCGEAALRYVFMFVLFIIASGDDIESQASS